MYALVGLANERWTATEQQIKNGEIPYGALGSLTPRFGVLRI